MDERKENSETYLVFDDVPTKNIFVLGYKIHRIVLKKIYCQNN